MGRIVCSHANVRYFFAKAFAAYYHSVVNERKIFKYRLLLTPSGENAKKKYLSTTSNLNSLLNSFCHAPELWRILENLEVKGIRRKMWKKFC